MDFFSGGHGKNESTTNVSSSAEHTQDPHRAKPTSSELLSSAKVVAESAQHAMRHETDKIDKQRFAGAAGDLLNAASGYGKLEEKGYGKYVDKAEDYLHKYSHGSGTAAGGGGQSHHHPEKTEGAAEAGSAGGMGDYMKMAQGFLKK